MKKISLIMLALACAGCANYQWTSGVPEEMRTVSVPMMRNESRVTQLGSIMTRQTLREFEREGTFKIKNPGSAALEVQGIVLQAGSRRSSIGYDRRTGLRLASYDFPAVVEISVVDKKSGRVLIDNRRYEAFTTLVAQQDIISAERDASGRLAEDLARQIVDDVLKLKFKEEKKK